jgi:hypothetical protein
MLALLFSRVGGYLIGGLVVVGLLGGAIFYVRHNEATITDLRQQMVTLKVQSNQLRAVYVALLADMLNVQHAEDATNQQLANIQNKASIAAQAVQTMKYTNNPAVQAQVNKDISDLFKQLEDISRAK